MFNQGWKMFENILQAKLKLCKYFKNKYKQSYDYAFFNQLK